MAKVKENFESGTKKVPFRLGAAMMQAFPIKQGLEASFNKIGAQWPAGLSKVNEPDTQR